MNIDILFQWIIINSLKGSVLVIIILFIRNLFKNRINSNMYCSLWLLLIVRLCIPSEFKSPLSIYNALDRLVYSESFSNTLGNGNSNLVMNWFSNDSINNVSLSKANMLNHFFRFIPYIWLIITLSILVLVLWENIKVHKQISKSLCQVKDKKLDSIFLKCKINMEIDNMKFTCHYSDSIASPRIYGICNTKLLFPKELVLNLHDNEIEHIIFHELAHYKRGDLILIIIVGFLKTIYWFNPIIWYGFYKMNEDIEIACDEMAIKNLGGTGANEYCMTIIKVIEKVNDNGSIKTVLGFLSYKNKIKRRIVMLKHRNKKSLKYTVGFLIAFTLIAFSFLTNAQETIELQLYSEVNISKIESALGDIDSNKFNKVIEFKGIWPVSGYDLVTSGYGKKIHPVTGEERIHTGVDIAAPEGQEIVASNNGKVVLSEEQDGYGKVIVVDHGNDYVTLYAHCSKLIAEVNQEVKQGEKIAEIGSTGRSTGPHLHFEVRKAGEHIDPLMIVEK